MRRAILLADPCRGMAPEPPPVAPTWLGVSVHPNLPQNVIFLNVIAQRVAKDAHQGKFLGQVFLTHADPGALGSDRAQIMISSAPPATGVRSMRNREVLWSF